MRENSEERIWWIGAAAGDVAAVAWGWVEEGSVLRDFFEGEKGDGCAYDVWTPVWKISARIGRCWGERSVEVEIVGVEVVMAGG